MVLNDKNGKDDARMVYKCNCIYTSFQVHDLEFAQIETQVVQGLQAGNESLKKLHEVKILF